MSLILECDQGYSLRIHPHPRIPPFKSRVWEKILRIPPLQTQHFFRIFKDTPPSKNTPLWTFQFILETIKLCWLTIHLSAWFRFSTIYFVIWWYFLDFLGTKFKNLINFKKKIFEMVIILKKKKQIDWIQNIWCFLNENF